MLLVVFSTSLFAGIRGHKWGQSVSETVKIEKARGSEIKNVNKDKQEIVVSGSVGQVEDFEITFKFFEQKLVSVSFFCRNNSLQYKVLIKALKKKYGGGSFSQSYVDNIYIFDLFVGNHFLKK